MTNQETNLPSRAGNHIVFVWFRQPRRRPQRFHPLQSFRTRSMKQHATNIVRELRKRGFEAYFAGGCVRDMLLGVAPADYDVATDATPPQVMRIFPETYAVGAQFGVVLVPF